MTSIGMFCCCILGNRMGTLSHQGNGRGDVELVISCMIVSLDTVCVLGCFCLNCYCSMISWERYFGALEMGRARELNAVMIGQ
jgi:hypothetical protein